MKIPYRFWIASMIFMTTFTNYMMRSNLSVSISAMQLSKGATQGQCSEDGYVTTAAPTTTMDPNATTTTTEKPEEEMFRRFTYTQHQQGLILAGYGIGYVLTSMPGGFLSEYYGPWKVIFFSTLASMILTVACVPAALLHWTALLVTRMVIGALGGVIYPAIQIIIANWAPKEEKGKFVSATLGNNMGTVVVFASVGAINQYFNWAWGFFFVAGVVTLYLILIFFLLSDSPVKSKYISEEERQYLATMVPPPKTKLVAPYLKIFSSLPFYALLFAHTANLYGLFVTMLTVPKFFREYLNQDLKRSGFLSALPPLTRMFAGMGFGAVGDYIEKKREGSSTAVRKSFCIFSHFLPGLCMICMMFVECNFIFATALLVMNQGFNGGAVCTNLRNSQDLAPNYSGTVFGIITLIGGCTQFIAPIIAGADDQGLDRWRWVFLIAGIIYCIGGFIFVAIGTTKQQPWNEPRQPETT
ncbi:unnamed protein product [Brassicogethes aeneus]|uniref:Major facilitator superfamily (MFS) profile domain-containing protein n=1 Tax=Brassicogethes aeneus TaxID=1431903 RepID=A0A9P0FMT5_BRAAE|nr:unnamed protein product [Brassicogethes aeneus]